MSDDRRHVRLPGTRRLPALLAAVMLPAAAQAADFVSITGNTVNVRKQPNTRSEVAWELSKGYPLQIEQRQGQWLKVRDFEESLGWVFSPLTGKTPHRVVTARIAKKDLAVVCETAGVPQPKDSAELHDRPLNIEINCERKPDGRIVNVITGVFKADVNHGPH